MSWLPLASRLGLHIALGYLLALLVLGPAPVGRFFYRLAGGTAAAAAVLAAAVALSAGLPAGTAERLRMVALLATALPAPLYASNAPARRRAGVLSGIAAAAAAILAHALGPDGLGPAQALADLCGAAVAGGVCFAMVFGHGYLTVPNLPVEHLRRIQRYLTGALLARLTLAAAVVVVAWPRLASREYGPEGYAGMGALDQLLLAVRFLAGLLLPLLFAAMAHSALRWGNTRSATGILYASTVLVWIGEVAALSFGRAWRVPL